MTDRWDERSDSDVRLDLSTLKGEPSGTDTRYAVSLRGPIDDRWWEGYQTLQAEPTAFRRFELDRASATIRFSCRTVDGTALVFEMLERIEGFVEHVNRFAAVRRLVSPRVSLSPAPLRAR
jgi:hypothetical protein